VAAGQACVAVLLLLGGRTAVAQIPTVSVDPAVSVTATTAAMNGTVNPQGQAAGCFIRYGTNTAYGSTSWPVQVPAANTAVAVSNSIFGLSPSTTYHYQLVATNSSGTGYSADMMLTTAAPPAGQPPTADTAPATAITTTTANLWGTVGSGGLVTTYYFRWGTDTTYGNAPPSNWIASNEGQVNVYYTLTNLSPGTTYHFQIVATNTAGTTYGADQSFATQGYFTNGLDVYTYLITNNTITITGYNGPGGQVAIPATMLGLPVTAIGGSGLANQSALTSVTIPNGVVVLGAGVFSSEIGLTNVLLPNSLASIEDSAFNSCTALTSVVIPDSVTNVGYSAFGSCSSLANLKIGIHVTFLGTLAFSFCPQLTRVVIPDSVTWIDDGLLYFGGPIGLFTDCTGLTNVTVGSGLTYLGIGTFSFCQNLTSVYFRGNVPSLKNDPYGERQFDYSDSVIVYYLPGTTGWGPTFAGRPTMLWNATMQTGNGGIGMQQNRFGFTLAGTPNIPLLIEACTDVRASQWVPLQTCNLTNGLLKFSDPDTPNYPSRFYRVRWP
jgi:hypothetical protein